MEITKSLFWGYKVASQSTGIPEGTLYAWVSEGRVPHIRLGKRHVLFRADELIRWIEEHTVPAEGER